MRPRSIHAARMRFSADAPPQPQRAVSRLVTLANWRAGSAATAITIGALLPFAAASHGSYLVAIGPSLIAAALLALCAHLALASQVRVLAIHPQFAHLPELAHQRTRLLSDRNRRALAYGLRRIAAAPQPSARFDCCPLLRDRVDAVTPQLLEIATALEHDHEPDVVCVALIRELLTNACSPLYNSNIPAASLRRTLTRIRSGLTSPSQRIVFGNDLADRDSGLDPERTKAPRRGHPRSTGRNHREIRWPLIGRCSARQAGMRVRLVSARNRRILARWLRRTAGRAPSRDPIRRRHDLLLYDRVTVVRADLLEIAVMLEHSDDPDPGCVAAVHDLMSDGCESPLYNPDVHVSELRATLYFVRSRLDGPPKELTDPRAARPARVFADRYAAVRRRR